MLKISLEITNEDLTYVENCCDMNRITFEEFFHQCVDLHRENDEGFKDFCETVGILCDINKLDLPIGPMTTKPEIAPESATKKKEEKK